MTLIAFGLSGCNSSDNQFTPQDPLPSNPGKPIIPPGGDGGDNGNDQTNPDNDADLGPSKDPEIIEAAQRWGVTYEEMYHACEMWQCDLSSVQERVRFSIERETQLVEGEATITFTLAEHHSDFWPSLTFRSPLIGHTSIEIEHATSTFHFNETGAEQNKGSTLLGWKTGVDNWATQTPRNCTEAYCDYLRTSWLENALYSNGAAVYRLDGQVTAVQRVLYTGEELKALYPLFNATFPEHY
ncbi:hypothetical protein [Vibrio mediterranei]|uniref:hypothetical protein n=1 Tax=Vibrio mediterranei TaxID=689 RepID=UPI0022845749|nr:hypothetical protein [Vibrio mediterranei]MCY9853085.1 hypothetical protein [Vibrio mediterranei]